MKYTRHSYLSTILIVQERQPSLISFPLKFLQSATSIIGSGGIPDYEVYVNGKFVEKVKQDVDPYKIKFMGSGENLIQVLYRHGNTKTKVWENKLDFEDRNEWTVRLR